MPDLGLLLLPLAALAGVALVGVGPSAALGAGLPRDAGAALAPVTGAALLAAASALLPLGVPAKPLALAVLGAGLAVALVVRREAVQTLRAGAVPAAVAAGAIALAGVPSVVRGDWQPASLYGSTDAYHWVSQGRAYFEQPALAPVAEHPDRLTYERSRTQHWAVALPFGAGLVAWLSDSDSAGTYGALAALLFAFVPLATYAAARACLRWRPAAAAAAGAALALNASLLFATHFSWQQQAAGAGFAFAAAALLRVGLADGSRRTLGLAAVLAAGAIGTYRLGFAPFLVALLAAVVLAYALRSGHPRTVARRAGFFGAAAAVLAAPSIVAVARGLPEYVGGGGFSTAFKEHFPAGQPGEALGLVPRVWALEESWPVWLRLTWLTAATLVAAALLVAGVRRARRERGDDFLLAGGALVLGGYLCLLLPAFSPYLSYKLLSYGAPFLVLLALSPLAQRSGPPLRALAAAGAVLLVASGAVATVQAERSARTPARLVDLRALPANAVVAVSTDDPWQQAWELYDLRDVRVSVERPTYLLTAQGREVSPSVYRRRPVTHAVVRTPAGAAAVVPR
jgi:hypothetical protein